jgi:hypothetical protein
LAKHGLRDGDIYMAVCCTASRYKPTSLAKSGSTTASEWRGGKGGRDRKVERKRGEKEGERLRNTWREGNKKGVWKKHRKKTQGEREKERVVLVEDCPYDISIIFPVREFLWKCPQVPSLSVHYLSLVLHIHYARIH